MKLEAYKKKCLDYFNEGYNCCESILLSGSKFLKLPQDFIPALGTPFGGGIVGNGYTCGALNAGLMLIGIKYGRNKAAENREPAAEKAQALIEFFSKNYSSLMCKDITNLNFKIEEDCIKYKNEIRNTICIPLLLGVCEWIKANM